MCIVFVGEKKRMRENKEGEEENYGIDGSTFVFEREREREREERKKYSWHEICIGLLWIKNQ